MVSLILSTQLLPVQGRRRKSQLGGWVKGERIDVESAIVLAIGLKALAY